MVGVAGQQALIDAVRPGVLIVSQLHHIRTGPSAALNIISTLTPASLLKYDTVPDCPLDL